MDKVPKLLRSLLISGGAFCLAFGVSAFLNTFSLSFGAFVFLSILTSYGVGAWLLTALFHVLTFAFIGMPFFASILVGLRDPWTSRERPNKVMQCALILALDLLLALILVQLLPLVMYTEQVSLQERCFALSCMAIRFSAVFPTLPF